MCDSSFVIKVFETFNSCLARFSIFFCRLISKNLRLQIWVLEMMYQYVSMILDID